MLDPVKNFAKVGVSIGYSAVATEIVLSSGNGVKLPQPSTDGAFNLVWWNSTDYPDPSDDPNVEIVRCTARSTDTLTVTRAQEGTSGSTKNTADKVYKMILALTAKMITDINSRMGYGVSWDEVSDTYTRIGATASQANGVALPNSLATVHAKMRRCLLANDGTVNYYLSSTDSTKKEDGVTPSVLTGADGQVMVEIPKFYYRYTYVGSTHSWEISPVPLTGFSVHPAFLSGSVEKDYLYIGAYEGILYDTSIAAYVSGLYLPAVSCVFAAADKSLTIATLSGWASTLIVGQKIIVTGTVNNNGTFTVVSIESGTKITVSEAVTDETAGSTVIEVPTDVTVTTGDKLSSVSGFAPIAGGTVNGTRAHFRVYATNRGTGWSQMFIDALSAVQLLYLVEYASFYSQSVLGAGISNVTDWSTYNNYNSLAKSGNSNVIGNASGNNAGSTSCATESTKYLSYRGIENLYGHIWKWCDGFKVNNNIPYVCNDVTKFDDDEDTTDYLRLVDVNGSDITMVASNGYQDTLERVGRTFVPSAVGGTADSSHKITDYYYQDAGWRVVRSGGDANSGADDGCFCLYGHNAASYLGQHVGGRLCFRK